MKKGGRMDSGDWGNGCGKRRRNRKDVVSPARGGLTWEGSRSRKFLRAGKGITRTFRHKWVTTEEEEEEEEEQLSGSYYGAAQISLAEYLWRCGSRDTCAASSATGLALQATSVQTVHEECVIGYSSASTPKVRTTRKAMNSDKIGRKRCAMDNGTGKVFQRIDE